MGYDKERRQKDREDLKRGRLPGIIAFLIGVIALAAFIVLNRLMAPPFPKNIGLTNSMPATATPAR